MDATMPRIVRRNILIVSLHSLSIDTLALRR
jgi:hypothetical protein